MHFLPLKNKYEVPDEREKDMYLKCNCMLLLFKNKSIDLDSPEFVF